MVLQIIRGSGRHARIHYMGPLAWLTAMVLSRFQSGLPRRLG